MIADQTRYQGLYDPKKLRMLMALMNTQSQAPQPNLMKPTGQQGNLGALAKGMPANIPGRAIRPPRVTNQVGVKRAY